MPQKRNPDLFELARGRGATRARRAGRGAGDPGQAAERLPPRPAAPEGAALPLDRPGAARPASSSRRRLPRVRFRPERAARSRPSSTPPRRPTGWCSPRGSPSARPIAGSRRDIAAPREPEGRNASLPGRTGSVRRTLRGALPYSPPRRRRMSRFDFELNGAQQQRGCRRRHAAALDPARHARTDRHQVRLRRRLLRRLHRARGGPRRARLPGHARRRRRPPLHDDRGALRRRQPPLPDRLDRGRRRAVRLLPARHDPRGRRAALARAASRRRRRSTARSRTTSAAAAPIRALRRAAARAAELGERR